MVVILEMSFRRGSYMTGPIKPLKMRRQEAQTPAEYFITRNSSTGGAFDRAFNIPAKMKAATATCFD